MLFWHPQACCCCSHWLREILGRRIFPLEQAQDRVLIALCEFNTTMGTPPPPQQGRPLGCSVPTCSNSPAMSGSPRSLLSRFGDQTSGPKVGSSHTECGSVVSSIGQIRI